MLFIQHDHVSPPGPICEAFPARGYDVEFTLVVPPERFERPDVTFQYPEPTDYDVLVPMGAPWSAYDLDRIGTWVTDEIAFLRAAHDAGVPILGLCFGGQLLAAALGGTVVAASRTELGWTTLTTDRPDLIEPGPWFEWHSDCWILPPGVTALARTPVCEQAFVVGRSLGLQFHPETTLAMLDGWLDNGGGRLVQAAGADVDRLRADSVTEGPAAERRAHRLVDRFLGLVATGHEAGCND